MRSIVPMNPLFLDIDRLLGDELSGRGNTFVPAVDIYQEKDNLVVEMPLPNIETDNVEISVENDVLTVSGHMRKKTETKREDYYRKEVREGSFSRSLILPMSVKGEKAEAVYDDGTLRIVLPKKEEAKPKKIAIKTKAKAQALPVAKKK
ncbi:MAG: Hsp20/alpha crystallin family protein [Candidatus Moranbacteria bacterium]|nr:Hsp20/alpha crystallin family protein [Candidatus Moranbacteria bacterium]